MKLPLSPFFAVLIRHLCIIIIQRPIQSLEQLVTQVTKYFETSIMIVPWGFKVSRHVAVTCLMNIYYLICLPMI